MFTIIGKKITNIKSAFKLLCFQLAILVLSSLDVSLTVKATVTLTCKLHQRIAMQKNIQAHNDNYKRKTIKNKKRFNFKNPKKIPKN